MYGRRDDPAKRVGRLLEFLNYREATRPDKPHPGYATQCECGAILYVHLDEAGDPQLDTFTEAEALRWVAAAEAEFGASVMAGTLTAAMAAAFEERWR